MKLTEEHAFSAKINTKQLYPVTIKLKVLSICKF